MRRSVAVVAVLVAALMIGCGSAGTDEPIDAAQATPMTDAPMPIIDAPPVDAIPDAPHADAFVSPASDAILLDSTLDVSPAPDACVPTGVEICNGLDDDCNGQIDEGFPGVGMACTVGVGACMRSGTTVCTRDGSSTVCNATPGVPAAAELCGNGIDDNCNGLIDEGFADLGKPCTAGVGACQASGVYVCSADKTGLTCNAVAGTPGPELCGNGIDDNCNGQVDEGFPSLGQRCTAGVGACERPGQIVCTADGTGTMCNAVAGTPGPELCGNDIDDNCNGQVDEGFASVGDRCEEGVGACERSGAIVCTPNGLGTMCSAAPGEPQKELCNGIDDDCDGVIDNGFPSLGNRCVQGVGACERTGAVVCTADGTGTMCGAVAGQPTKELCNGIDDDCDGVIDNGFSLGGRCIQGVGACERPGAIVCTADGTGTMCSAVPAQPSKELCNGIDDDCDGVIDNGFPGLGQACTAGVGACQRSGTIVCTADGTGTMCNAVPGTPGPELCGNGIDDNCNGQVDEGFPSLGDRCVQGVGACERPGSIICTADGTGTMCSAVPGEPSPDICNGIDDDCNPATPDGADDPELNQPCGGRGTCGQFECAMGTLTCTNLVSVNTETDPDNCGSCGNECPAVAHGSPGCSNGACYPICATNYKNCNGACVSSNAMCVPNN